MRLWVYEVPSFDGEPRGLRPRCLVVPAGLPEGASVSRANDAIVRAVGLPRITRILDAKLARDPKGWVTKTRDRGILYLRSLSWTRS